MNFDGILIDFYWFLTLAYTADRGIPESERGVRFFALSCDNSAIVEQRKMKVTLRAHGPGGTLCTCAPRQLRAPCKMVRWKILFGGVPFLAGVGINKGPPPLPPIHPPNTPPNLLSPRLRLYITMCANGAIKNMGIILQISLSLAFYPTPF
jgi:hypothetical protein